MENSPRLYSELVALCGQPGQWCDVRHLQTLVWMVVGLIQAEGVKLTAWVQQFPVSEKVEKRRGVGHSSFCA